VNDSYTGALRSDLSSEYISIQGIEVINSGFRGYGFRGRSLGTFENIIAEGGVSGFFHDGAGSGDPADLILRNILGISTTTGSTNSSGVSTNSFAYGTFSNLTGIALNGADYGCRLFSNRTATTIKNCVGYGSIVADIATTTGPTISNNASGDASGDITGITTADFVDYAGGNYRPAFGSVLRGAGADLSGTFTADIGGQKRYDWTIGAFEMPAAHYARLQQVSDGEPNSYTDLVAAESAMQGDLAVLGTALFEFEAGTYTGNFVFSGWTNTDPAYIYLNAALGAEHNGVFDTGAILTSTGWNAQTLSTTVFVQLTDISVHHNSSAGVCINALRRAVRTITKVGAGFAHSMFANTRYAENCVAVNGGNQFSGVWSGSAEYLNCTAINSRGKAFIAGANGTTDVRNCVALNVDGDAFFEDSNGIFIAGSDYNASEDGTAPGDNSIIITADAFADTASSNYRPAFDSALRGAGEDLSGDFTRDIGGQLRYDWTIGAYEMPAAHYARVMETPDAEANSFSGLQAAEAYLQGDLAATGIALIECEAFTETPGATTTVTGYTNPSATNYLAVRNALSADHNGQIGAGYVLSVSGGYTQGIVLANTMPYTQIHGIEFVSTGIAGLCSALLSYANFAKIDRVIASAASTAAFEIRGGGTITNSLAYDSSVGFNKYQFYNGQSFLNCTAVDCATGFLQSSSGGVQSILWQNCVAVECTTDYNLAAGSVDAATDYLAGSDSTASTYAATTAITGITTADFVDYDGGDYRPTNSSALAGAGVDLSASFTTDITGAIRTVPWDIGAFIAEAGSGGTTEEVTLTYSVTFDALPVSDAVAEAAVSAGPDLSAIVAGGVDAETAAAYGLSLDKTLTGDVSIEAALDYALQVTKTASSDVTTEAATSAGIQLAQASTAVVIAEAAIAQVVDLGQLFTGETTSDVQAFMTAALQAAADPTADATAEAVATLAAQLGTSTEAVATALAESAAGVSLSETAIGETLSDVQAFMVAALQVAASSIAEADAEATATLAAQLGTATSAIATALAESTADVSLDKTTSGEVIADTVFPASLSVALSLDGTATADAQAAAEMVAAAGLTANAAATALAEASLIATAQLASTAIGETGIDATILSAAQLGASATAEPTVEANMTAEASLAAQADAQATATAAALMTTELATTIVAEALVELGVEYASIQNVVFNGATITADYTTPDSRTFVVAIETRAFSVTFDKRTFDVLPDDS
jgi:hypothetical protein